MRKRSVRTFAFGTGVTSLLLFFPLNISSVQADENILGTLFHNVGHYIEQHREGREKIIWEEELPERFKRDIAMDGVYAPFNLPYSYIAVALYYDSSSQYDRSSYYYDMALREALIGKQIAALSMVVLSKIISDQTAGEISKAFADVQQIPRVWQGDYMRWTVDVAKASLNLNIGDPEAAAKALQKAREGSDLIKSTQSGNFGKEFGALYLLFQMDKMEGMLKYLDKNFQDATRFLEKAQACA